MGKLWRIDKAPENSEGLRWVRERLEAYDWSKVDWITVRRGRSERYAFRGMCRSPSIAVCNGIDPSSYRGLDGAAPYTVTYPTHPRR